MILVKVVDVLINVLLVAYWVFLKPYQFIHYYISLHLQLSSQYSSIL